MDLWSQLKKKNASFATKNKNHGADVNQVIMC